MDAGVELKISVLDAMQWLKLAWDRVTPDTIRNCFAHCKFQVTTSLNDPEYVTTSDDEKPELDIMFGQCKLHNIIVESSPKEYITIDADIAIDGAFTDEEIVRMVHDVTPEEPSTCTLNLEEDEPVTCPTNAEFRNALDIVQRYVTFHSDGRQLTVLHELEELLFSRTMPQQSSITDFF